MGNERTRAIEQAIDADAGWQLQRLITHLLKADLYPSLNPLPRTKDLGQDARTEPVLVPHGGKTLSFGISKTATLTKVKEDCDAIKSANHEIDAFVFTTSGVVTGETRKKWEAEIRRLYGWELIVHDASWLMTVIERPEFEAVVDSTLNVPPPGGDFLSAISDSFDRITDGNVRAIRTEIAELGGPLDRPEYDAVINEWDGIRRPILLTGDAGSGKSAIAAKARAHATLSAKATLFLDCSRLAGVTSEAELSSYLGLNASASSAVARLGRAKGVVVIADQLDNLGDSPATRVITNFLIDVSKLEGVATLAISRKWDLEHRQVLAALPKAGFVEIASVPLDEKTAAELLKRLGIDPAPRDLVDLARNLLNLSLVADLINNGGSVQVEQIHDEVGLWSRYRASLEEREGADKLPAGGRRVIEAAVRLAKDSLRRSTADCELGFPPPIEEERLVSRGVLIQSVGRVHRFRHEQLADYFYAWDTTERGLMADAVIHEIGERQASRALTWMMKLYRHAPPAVFARFVDSALTLDALPFFSRAALVDVVRSIERPTDADVASMLRVVRARDDVRIYFFTGPFSPEWISSLVRDVIVSPTEDYGPVLKTEVARLLGASARELPHLVVEALSKVDKQLGAAVYHLVRSLAEVPLDHAAAASATIAEVLAVNADHDLIEHDIAKYIVRLATSGKAALTLPLCRLLLTAEPQAAGQYLVGGAVKARFDRSWFVRRREIPAALAAECPNEAVHGFETTLLETLQLDRTTRGHAPDKPEPAYWRSAIENSDQDANPDVLDFQLLWLRDVVESWLASQDANASATVRRYLGSNEAILRRLALHCIRVNPGLFRGDIARVLLDRNLMSEYSIHHEYFVLLRDGYAHLSQNEQDELLAAIQQGPSSDEVEEVRTYHRAKGVDEEEVDERIVNFREHWIAQRLWMIRSSLAGSSAERLRTALAHLEVQEIEHPEFLSWVGDASPVDRTPVTTQDFVAMDPQNIVDLIRQWRPPAPAPGSFPFMGPTVEKLAMELAGAIRAVPARLLSIVRALADGEPYPYLYQYFLAVKELAQDKKNSIPWDAILDVADKMVDPTLHPELWDPNTSKHGPFLPFIWAMNEAIRGDALDDVLLARLRAVLLRLSEHPDRTGSNDAATDALNHVVPQAVESLIITTSVQAERTKKRGLDDAIRDLLERSLVDESDDAGSLFWVLGRLFARLNWLDHDWAVANVDRIFGAPNEKLAAAAFEGHLRADFHLATYPLVREQYRRFLNVETNQHKLEEAAANLAHAYLFKADELPSADPTGLLAVLFAKHAGHVAARIPWLYYREMHEEQKSNSTAFLDKYWPRLRGLFLWRASIANDQGFPVQVDEELDWYAHWIRCLSDAHETLSVRLDMLNRILPFLCRARYGARNDVIAFLAEHVEESPLEIVKLLRRMCEGVPTGAFVGGTVTPEVRKIVESAASLGGEARDHALAVANWYGARGSLGLRDVYERYHRA